MNPIQNLWQGKYPLWLAFWVFYIVGYLAANALTLVIAPYFDTQPWRWLAVALLVMPYNVLSTVGVWRSADAYPLSRWWPNIAKIFVSIWSGRTAWQWGQATLIAWKEWMT